MPVDDVCKQIPPKGMIASKVTPVHPPDLISTYAGVLRTDLFDVLQCKGVPGRTGQDL